MKNDRDEILYVPRDTLGGFMCPNCLSIAIGDKWADKAKYCPECGQHIKVIAQDDFKELEQKAKGFDKEELDKIAKMYMGHISGIYKSRLEKVLNDENYIAGQMELSDFLLDQ